MRWSACRRAGGRAGVLVLVCVRAMCYAALPVQERAELAAAEAETDEAGYADGTPPHFTLADAQQ